MGTHVTSAARRRSIATVLVGVLVAAMAVLAGTSMASARSHGSMASMSSSRAGHVGTTKGWLNGRTVKFVYTKNFFCKSPPSSHAGSHCELGANYNSIPAKDFDPLYVVVPVGFTPGKRSLQCPTAGKCIDHPSHIDLSRVFGSGTGKALLPPHSHIVTTAAGHGAEWWNVDVVGVTNQQTWHKIVTHKSYRTIARMRANGNSHVTDNLPTNLFLFFRVAG